MLIFLSVCLSTFSTYLYMFYSFLSQFIKMFKYISVFICILLLSLLSLYFTSSNFSYLNLNLTTTASKPLKHERIEEIILVVVVCEDRSKEALTMVKSALVSTSPDQPIRFIIFADVKLVQQLNETLSNWQSRHTNKLKFEVRHISFPNSAKDKWRQLFKPCSSQRLFLPRLLDTVDSLLYVDSDTLFMVPPADIWYHFSKMNSSQMAALAPEHEDFNTGWYNRFAKIPYYGPFGVNTGIMLMNLTRMRQFKWEEYVTSVYHQYRLNIPWGDQDIINVIFHYHPDKLYVYPCQYNYRTDHCKYMSVCRPAEKHGVAVLHGSRSAFHNKGHLAFQAIYRAFDEFELGSNAYENLILPMRMYLEKSANTKCGQLKDVLIKNLEATIKARNSHGPYGTTV